MNCKKEFLAETSNKEILCCQLVAGYDWGDEEQRIYNLPVNYSQEQFEEFLNSLDFTYDPDGSQELFGLIWYKDGTWSEREEYDGSEWWSYKSCPEIPPELKSSEEGTIS